MAQLPSIKEQTEKLNEEIRQETERWAAAGIPDPGLVWEQGRFAFAFRCETLTIIELIMEKLDVTQEEMDLRMKKIILREMKALYPQYKERAAEARRQMLLQGIDPFNGNPKQ